MNKQKVPDILEAIQDRRRWEEHVRRQRQVAENCPDLFFTRESAEEGAKALLFDFEDEPEDSVVTIFSVGDGNYKIDAISNYSEFELHRNEYDPEDVVALVFFREDKPFVKSM